MTASKIVAAAASGAGGGAGLDVDEVFSTFLYDGTGSAQTITNNIDLSGEGGLTWTKCRNIAHGHALVDTVNGAQKYLVSEGTDALRTDSYAQGGLTSFSSTGYVLGSDPGSDRFNRSGRNYVSWTFRKAEGFMDIQTWTGNSTENRKISHNLGCEVGMILLKRTSSSRDWVVYHRGNTAAPETDILKLNTTDATSDLGSAWYDTAPTSTEFTLGDQIGVNANGETYVAYLFAHNNNDGGFGPDQDEDIIKCGSYTGNGSTTGPVVTLGFEPQWLMIKAASRSGEWIIHDNMRGMAVSGDDPFIIANGTGAEQGGDRVDITATGFKLTTDGTIWNDNNETYIYMAIRRGPLAAPDDATKVFAMDRLGGTSPTPPGFNSGFPVDMAFLKLITSSSDFLITSRLMQKKQLVTNNENAEVTENGNRFDYQNGYYDFSSSASNYQAWMWKRARGYFDVVCYDGSGSNRTINHNLGVAPEMMWVKSRSNSGLGWMVYHSGTGATHYMMLNSTGAAVDLDVIWNDTTPTSSVFSVGTGGSVNDSGKTYIAYLFATVAGVSKVGSYTGNGSSQNIDCGFSNGARFVLIKKHGNTGGWNVYDTARGLVAGNDHRLQLEDNGAEITDADQIDPLSSGFTVVDNTTNQNNHTFIFYAIA